MSSNPLSQYPHVTPQCAAMPGPGLRRQCFWKIESGGDPIVSVFDAPQPESKRRVKVWHPSLQN